ncbi:MAG: hypothetical protein IV100_30075 [Myxococcales bacterium]|nr:hypothetical protein [Myxococcales bacterium]
MMNSSHILAVCLGYSALATPALADDSPAPPQDATESMLASDVDGEGVSVWHAGATVDLSTRCVGRGVPCSTGGVILPTVEFGAYGLTASFTAYLGFDEESPQALEEFDVGLSWSHAFDDLTLEVGAFGLTFPGLVDAHEHVELVASLAYALGPVSVVTEHVVEVLAEPGAYYGEVGIEAEFKLTSVLSTTLSTAFGWASAKYNSDMFDVHDVMPQAIGGEVSLSWDIGDGFAIEPHGGAWYSTDSRAREALETDVVWNAGLAVAGAW